MIDSGRESLLPLVVWKQALHLLMVGQVLQNMPGLCGFPVSMALIPVQMAMTDCMILECPVRKGANDSEALLCRLFSLQFVVLRAAFLTFLLCPNFSHLQAELSHGHLCKTHHLHRCLSSH